MTNLDIRINILKLSNYSGSLRDTMDEKTLIKVVESFSYYVMHLYGALIEEAIYSSRYKGKWEPVDEEGYIEYLGTTPEKNILYLIRDALEVRKSGYSFIVGINHRYKYPGSKLTLLRVLRAIESGTTNFNSRPILVKVNRKIESNISSLWRGYLKMKNIV